MADPRCLPRIPWEKWAVDGGLPNGEQDWENWRYLRVWAQQLLDNCMASGAGEFVASWADFVPFPTGNWKSTRYYPPGAWSLSELRISLDSVQADPITFEVYVNGASSGATVTLGALDNFGSNTVSISGDDGDYLEWLALDAGTGGGIMLTLQGIGSGVSAGLDLRYENPI